MEVAVTPSTLARVLRDNQPNADRSQTIAGLFLLFFALTDLAATASLGIGVTAALSGWLIRSAGWPFLPVTGLLSAVIDGVAFLMGLSLVRGTRWQAVFKTSLRKSLETAPLVSKTAIEPRVMVRWIVGIVIGAVLGVPLYYAGGLVLALGMLLAALTVLVVAIATCVVVVGVLGTTHIERPSVVTASFLVLLLLFVLGIVTQPLSETLSATPQHAVGQLCSWTTLALMIGLGAMLFLGIENMDDTLTMILNWDPDVDPSLGSYFQRNREEMTLTRKCVLKILTPRGRPLLVATKHIGEERMRVADTVSLDAAHAIDLNETGFALLDLRKMAENMSPALGRQPGPNGELTYSDPDNVVSFDIRIMVLTSTTALPKDLTLAEETFAFLRDYLFASNVLGPMIDSILATTVSRLTKDAANAEQLASLRADWTRHYHALDFVDDVEAMRVSHVLDRTPGVMQSYREKLSVGAILERDVAEASANIQTLRPKLNSICSSIKSEFETFVLQGIDDLIERSPTLSPEEKTTIRTIVKLFKIEVTATPDPQRESALDKMKAEADSIRAKLAADIKDAKAEVVKAQTEVVETVRMLLAKPMMSGAERRFLESWRPSAPPLGAQQGQPALQASPVIISQPATSSGQASVGIPSQTATPAPNPSAPGGGTGFTRRRF